MIGPEPPVVEPGWQTTEFWASAATSLIGMLVMLGVVHPSSAQTDSVVGAITLFGPQVAYAISRGLRKHGQ